MTRPRVVLSHPSSSESSKFPWSSKISDLAIRHLEAVLGGQRKQPLWPNLKELTLKKAGLIRTDIEQEKRERAITDLLAGLGGQFSLLPPSFPPPLPVPEGDLHPPSS